MLASQSTKGKVTKGMKALRGIGSACAPSGPNHEAKIAQALDSLCVDLRPRDVGENPKATPRAHPRREVRFVAMKAFPIDGTEKVPTLSGVTFDAAVTADGKGALKLEGTQPTTFRLFEVTNIEHGSVRRLQQEVGQGG